MKRWAVVLCVSGLALGTFGCESKEPVDEPALYDPDVDAPPSVLTVHEVPDVPVRAAPRLGAGEAPAALPAKPGEPAGPVEPGAPAPAPAPAPAGQAVEGVKQAMAGIIQAAKAERYNRMPAFMTDADAAAISNLARDYNAMVKKAKGFQDFAKAVADIDLSGKGPLTEKPKGLPMIGEGLENLAVDALTFEAQGANVIVTAPGGVKMTFVQEGGLWKRKLTAKDKMLVGLSKELFGAYDDFMDAVKTGIDAGSITKDNIDQKGQELLEKLRKRIGELAVEVVGKTMLEQVLKEVTPPSPESPRP